MSINENAPLDVSSTALNQEPHSVEVAWLAATDPRIITPISWKRGGMASVTFASLTTHVAKIVRTIGKMRDKTTEMQDEIFGATGPQGTQFNYIFDAAGNLTPKRATPVEHLDRLRPVVAAIAALVGQPGSTIMARNRDGDTEGFFISDGSRWYPARYGESGGPERIAERAALRLQIES